MSSMANEFPPSGATKLQTVAEIEVRSPYDGTVVGRAPSSSRADVDAAVARGLSRLRSEPLAAWQRADILDRAAAALEAHREDLARTVAAEAAKPIRTARIEAERAVSTFRFAATEARGLTGETVPLDASEAGAGKLGFTLRVPVGVVGGITPFNFPLNLVAHKVAPAVAAGCPIVLKPASQTPLSALALARILVDECGLPADYLSVVCGPAAEVGAAIVEHLDIPLITFTGSPDVGWEIRGRAPRKEVLLELGNNSPVIIDDGADIETAAAKISVAGFSHAGQSCISTQRVLVHRQVAPAFLAALLPAVEALTVGDPMDDATDVSALIDADARDRVKGWIDEAVAGGATRACGGEVDGNAIRPTVLTDVAPDMKVCREEVFGPVVTVQTFTDLDQALRLANDTRYGLQAAIFTPALDHALRAARELDFGGVLVNETPTWRADQMPYGGERDSGNTREGPAYAVRSMTRSRLVVISL